MLAMIFLAAAHIGFWSWGVALGMQGGTITIAREPGPTTYGLVDETAVRVLRTGGTVKAVRREDLPDDSPVAATFRGPL